MHLGSGADVAGAPVILTIFKVKVFTVEDNPFDKLGPNGLSNNAMRCVSEAPVPKV
jgi:hypothetical protein